jgi:hypothetical protein
MPRMLPLSPRLGKPIPGNHAPSTRGRVKRIVVPFPVRSRRRLRPPWTGRGDARWPARAPFPRRPGPARGPPGRTARRCGEGRKRGCRRPESETATSTSGPRGVIRTWMLPSSGVNRRALSRGFGTPGGAPAHRPGPTASPWIWKSMPSVPPGPHQLLPDLEGRIGELHLLLLDRPGPGLETRKVQQVVHQVLQANRVRADGPEEFAAQGLGRVPVQEGLGESRAWR